MKHGAIVASFLGVLFVGLIVTFSCRHEHDPKDFSYWLQAGAGKDWSSEAAQGKAEAEFYLGLTLIRTNLVTMIDEVPRLSAVPIIGRLFFKKITYSVDNGIAQEQLEAAYQWITKSADGGFAPAIEAEKLFLGRVATTNTSAQRIGAKRFAEETNRASSATGSRR